MHVELDFALGSSVIIRELFLAMRPSQLTSTVDPRCLPFRVKLPFIYGAQRDVFPVMLPHNDLLLAQRLLPPRKRSLLPMTKITREIHRQFP